jgi:hypothetical protein
MPDIQKIWDITLANIKSIKKEENIMPNRDRTGRLGLGKNCDATAKASSRGGAGRGRGMGRGRGRGMSRGLGRKSRGK